MTYFLSNGTLNLNSINQPRLLSKTLLNSFDELILDVTGLASVAYGKLRVNVAQFAHGR